MTLGDRESGLVQNFMEAGSSRRAWRWKGRVAERADRGAIVFGGEMGESFQVFCFLFFCLGMESCKVREARPK